MQADIFFKEFAALAAGPGGVQKLRDLVLKIAVRGKLVGQSDSDGNAGSILSEIEQGADAAIQKRWAKYGPVEGLFSTPTNWSWTSIGRMSRDWGQKIPDRAFQYIDVGGIDNLNGRIGDDLELTQPEDAPSRARKLVAQGTVIYSTVRPYLKNIAVVDREFSHEPIASTAFAIVHPLGGILPEYVFYYLRSPDFVSYVEGQMKGAAYPAINDGKFFAAPIPLPPIAEQERMVAKISQLMALCDDLEVQQSEEAELKRATAASALHHLVEAQNSKEAADCWVLLKTRFADLFNDSVVIAQLREALLELSITGHFDQLSGVDGSDVKICEIGEIVSVVGGSTPSKQQTDFWDGDIPWISPKDMKVAEIDDAIDHLTDKAISDTSIKLLSPGSVLTVVRGMILAKTLPVAILRSPATINQDMKALVPKGGILSDYLALVLNGSRKRALDLVERSTHGTCRLDTDKLLSIQIRLMSEDDQRCIVAKVDELMALCDQLEEQVREDERLNTQLMASLAHALTETDPGGGGAAKSVSFAEDTSAIPARQSEGKGVRQSPEGSRANIRESLENQYISVPKRAASIDSKFQEAVLVGALINEFFKAGGEPIGNFRLQKAVYFARRHNGEHVDKMEYLRKAAGPYNPSMKYSGGIAIAKQKNWLREAKGRFGFGHMPGPSAGEMADWIAQFGFGETAQWVADRFRFKKNEDWEVLATVDYAIEYLLSLGIEPDAAQILQFIEADDEWRPKIEKLRLTDTSIEAAMVEVKALFGTGSEERAQ